MFIVSLTYKSPMEEVEKHLQAHREYLKEEYSKGHFLFSGRKNPRTGGIVLSSIKDRDELQKVLEKDPFYQADVAEYDVTEFTATMAAEGLEKFKDQ